jgi:hypothetical protein
MCFGVRGKIFVNQMEMALGILPSGTGTQRYPRLIGRNRAVEVIWAAPIWTPTPLCVGDTSTALSNRSKSGPM